jgi:hypothetical protein
MEHPQDMGEHPKVRSASCSQVHLRIFAIAIFFHRAHLTAMFASLFSAAHELQPFTRLQQAHAHACQQACHACLHADVESALND